MTKAAIIVVTYNSARFLARQRAALDALTERDWELIVLDNASAPDQRPDRDKLSTNAKIIQNETNLGFAEGNNVAARATNAPYLVFLNPDAFPKPDWLAQLVAAAERYPEAAAIGSTQVRADAEHILDGTGDVLHASGLAYRSNYGKPRAPPPLGESFGACAAAMLVRRAAFEAVGGFDARYFCFFEDVDLSFRLRLVGWRIVQSPDAIVAHVGGGSTASSAFAEFHGARNRLWTFVKCMPAPLFWPLLLPHMLTTALVATLALVTGRGVAAWRGLLAGYAGLGPIWRARRDVQAKRQARTAHIAAALAWNPLVLFGRRPVIRPLRASPPTAASDQS